MTDDSKSSDAQYSLSVSIKEHNANSQSLVLTVMDKHFLRKYSNTYTQNALRDKGLTQTADKLQNILETAASNHNKKKGWDLRYGYHKNTSKTDTIDRLAIHLTASESSSLRKEPRSGDTLYIILSIQEEYFSVDTQFRLHEIDKPKKTKRRTLSNAPKPIGIHFASPSTPSFPLNSDEAQKIEDLKAKIKSLTRDNQVLKRKVEKLESTSGKKQKKMDSEREMRLQANKERFWLKQKLERLQKAIAARLKILGVDFSQVEDITGALDMAFNVIQKLAKELQEKEDGFEDMKTRMTAATKESTELRKDKDTLTATLDKHRSALQDFKKQIADRERRLSVATHEKNDTQSMLTKQVQDLKDETESLRAEKEKIFNQMVDERSALKRELDDKRKALQEIQLGLNKAKEGNDKLSAESEQIKDDNAALLNAQSDLEAKLQEALKEIEDVKGELEVEQRNSDARKQKNQKLRKEVKALYAELTRLKKLLEKATAIEQQLKECLTEASELAINAANGRDKMNAAMNSSSSGSDGDEVEDDDD
eukprot:CAMPEP_0202696094 /NCGR_PEP_ID=MMETSP1385-20130828/9451_1 /ASSEMBLY_ACC=CAM_ASM_000861 /TAXON_ID=933848 /ORGANISM="Elphidium margaritaceum" /LENGTH=536 /DNA_ID=CAMNT_0049352205 /DNA_START=37 /DNA_END=1647 /DNA_ORIENTATION=+